MGHDTLWIDTNVPRMVDVETTWSGNDVELSTSPNTHFSKCYSKSSDGLVVDGHSQSPLAKPASRGNSDAGTSSFQRSWHWPDWHRALCFCLGLVRLHILGAAIAIDLFCLWPQEWTKTEDGHNDIFSTPKHKTGIRGHTHLDSEHFDSTKGHRQVECTHPGKWHLTCYTSPDVKDMKGCSYGGYEKYQEQWHV